MKDETVDVKRDGLAPVSERTYDYMVMLPKEAGVAPMQTPFAELDRLLEAQDLRVPQNDTRGNS